ncbi:MAG: DUF4332 domain-containing protein [Anaerolineae bacterium]|nr:DUF4332 domain-containing protein [Anaerolineae bacterium]
MAWYWWLILGILIGWLIGWLVEVCYWRRRRLAAETPLVRAEARVKELEASLESCQARVTELHGEIEKRDLQIADLKRMLGARLQVPAAEVGEPELEVKAPAVAARLPEVEVAAPELEAKLPEVEPAEVEVTAPEFAVALPQAEVRMDDLTRIRGIGPKLAQTLQAAGITSFAQLADADEERLAAIIQAPAWRRLDYGDWILQARALRDQPPAPAMPGDDLERIEGIGPRYAALLREAGITTFAELAASDEATLAAIIGAPAWRRVDYAMWIEQARLAAAGEEAALAELQARLHRREADNLTLIQGIGARTAAALRDAGIASLADLAAADEAQLAGIIEAAGVRGGDYAAWIEEARLRAAGRRVVRRRAVTAERVGIPAQDLTAIRGIGPVFEQKFYAAGIGTYAQLAALSDDQIKAIIQPQEWQEFDYESWNEQARRLAEETGTVGAVWNGVIPDDLSQIKGIGEVFEQKLYQAGIMTFADLAARTPEELKAIIQPEEWQALDFADWIAQARARA